jgi:hypothetical protein
MIWLRILIELSVLGMSFAYSKNGLRDSADYYFNKHLEPLLVVHREQYHKLISYLIMHYRFPIHIAEDSLGDLPVSRAGISRFTIRRPMSFRKTNVLLIFFLVTE